VLVVAPPPKQKSFKPVLLDYMKRSKSVYQNFLGNRRLTPLIKKNEDLKEVRKTSSSLMIRNIELKTLE